MIDIDHYVIDIDHSLIDIDHSVRDPNNIRVQFIFFQRAFNFVLDKGVSKIDRNSCLEV